MVDPESAAYASCLCDNGAGGAAVGSCMALCNIVDSVPIGIEDVIAAGLYYYCVRFYPREGCPTAQEYLYTEDFAKYCASEGSGSGSNDSE